MKINTENSETYNGWTNYATWRINIENFSDMRQEDLVEMYGQCEDIYDIAQSIEEEVKERIYAFATDDIISGYALAFIHNVNWYEIASHIKEDME